MPVEVRHALRTVLAALALAVAVPFTAPAHEEPALQEDELSRQIALHPDDARLYLQRADLRRSRREWAAGVADLQTASRLDPGLTVVDLSLAQLLLGADNPQPALTAVDRFLARHDNHAGAHLTRARILVKLGSRDDAVGEFTRGIDLARRGPEGSKGAQPDDYLDRARVLECDGGTRIDDAVRGLDEGTAVLGGAITLQMLAVDLEVERRNWDAALQRLAALEASAHRKESWIARRADVLVQAGRLDEARHTYASALAAIDTLPQRLRTTTTTSTLASSIRSALSDLDRSSVPPSTFVRARLSGSADCPTTSSPM